MMEFFESELDVQAHAKKNRRFLVVLNKEVYDLTAVKHLYKHLKEKSIEAGEMEEKATSKFESLFKRFKIGVVVQKGQNRQNCGYTLVISSIQERNEDYQQLQIQNPPQASNFLTVPSRLCPTDRSPKQYAIKLPTIARRKSEDKLKSPTINVLQQLSNTIQQELKKVTESGQHTFGPKRNSLLTPGINLGEEEPIETPVDSVVKIKEKGPLKFDYTQWSSRFNQFSSEDNLEVLIDNDGK